MIILKQLYEDKCGGGTFIHTAGNLVKIFKHLRVKNILHFCFFLRVCSNTSFAPNLAQ